MRGRGMACWGPGLLYEVDSDARWQVQMERVMHESVRDVQFILAVGKLLDDQRTGWVAVIMVQWFARP